MNGTKIQPAALDVELSDTLTDFEVGNGMTADRLALYSETLRHLADELELYRPSFDRVGRIADYLVVVADDLERVAADDRAASARAGQVLESRVS